MLVYEHLSPRERSCNDEALTVLCRPTLLDKEQQGSPDSLIDSSPRSTEAEHPGNFSCEVTPRCRHDQLQHLVGSIGQFLEADLVDGPARGGVGPRYPELRPRLTIHRRWPQSDLAVTPVDKHLAGWNKPQDSLQDLMSSSFHPPRCSYSTGNYRQTDRPLLVHHFGNCPLNIPAGLILVEVL